MAGQESLRADVALIRARAADELGKLVYSKGARNFNPDMATAAEYVVAEVTTFEVRGAHLVLTDVTDGYSLDWVQEHTAAPFVTP